MRNVRTHERKGKDMNQNSTQRVSNSHLVFWKLCHSGPCLVGRRSKKSEQSSQFEKKQVARDKHHTDILSVERFYRQLLTPRPNTTMHNERYPSLATFTVQIPHNRIVVSKYELKISRINKIYRYLASCEPQRNDTT